MSRRSNKRSKKRKAKKPGPAQASAPAASYEPGEQRDRRILAGALLIILCGAVAYSSSFAGEFYFDDKLVLSESNPHLVSLWPLSEAMKAPPTPPRGAALSWRCRSLSTTRWGGSTPEAITWSTC